MCPTETGASQWYFTANKVQWDSQETWRMVWLDRMYDIFASTWLPLTLCFHVIWWQQLQRSETQEPKNKGRHFLAIIIGLISLKLHLRPFFGSNHVNRHITSSRLLFVGTCYCILLTFPFPLFCRLVQGRLGAMLSQLVEGAEHTVLYMSRKEGGVSEKKNR